MLNIGFALGVDGYLSSDIATGLLKENIGGLDFNIELLGIKISEYEYDILVLNQYKKTIDIKNALEKVSDNGILLLNSDEAKFYNLEFVKPMQLVTFGFNNKSSITISSVLESDFLSIQCCIQRSIFDIYDNEIYPQEFTIDVHDENVNVYDALSIISTVILLGVNIEGKGSLFTIKHI